MSLPRITLRTVDAPPEVAAPTATTKAIIVGEAELGALGSITLRSMRDWKSHLLGARTGAALPNYDAADVAFREGYPMVVYTRVVGPGAAVASANAPGGTGTALTVRANSPGEWGNGATGGLTFEIVNGPGGGTERVIVIRRGGTEVERSPAFTAASKATVLAAWGEATNPDRTAKWVVVELGADTGLPTVAVPVNLAGGLADLGGVTSTQVREALDRVGPEIGPGQVFAPWRTAAGTHAEVLAHCAARNRIALLDGVQGSTVSTLVALAASSTALGAGAEGLARLGGLWGQYAIGPGLTPGTTRTVPFSIVAGALLARAVARAGHDNVQPVGVVGVPAWATRVDRYFDETVGGDGDTLYDGGVNVVVQRNGRPRNWTFRSFETGEWEDLAHSNYERGMVARAREIGEGMRDGTITIDEAIPRFGGLLRLMLSSDQGDGAIDGSAVNVESVNDATTKAAGELNAAVAFQAGEHVHDVNITLAKTPSTQEV